MVPVLSRSREFSLFLDGTGTGKNWSQKKEPVPVPENVLWCTFFEKVHIWNTLLDGQSSRQSNDPQFLKHIRVGELWLKRATESSGCCGCGGSWITEPFYQQPHSQSLATKQPGTSKVTASSLPNWLQIWGSNKQRVSTFVLESQIADCQAESFVSNWNWKKVPVDLFCSSWSRNFPAPPLLRLPCALWSLLTSESLLATATLWFISCGFTKKL